MSYFNNNTRNNNINNDDSVDNEDEEEEDLIEYMEEEDEDWGGNDDQDDGYDDEEEYEEDDDDEDDEGYTTSNETIRLLDLLYNSYRNRLSGAIPTPTQDPPQYHDTHIDLTHEKISHVIKQRTKESNMNQTSFLYKREIYGQKYGEPIRFLHNYLPRNYMSKKVVQLNHRIFCCKLTADARTLMTASQDSIIRFYDTNTWEEKKNIAGRYISWSIIDTDFSENQQYLIYSSWSPFIHICSTIGEDTSHHSLDLEPSLGGDRFCIFGLKFSPGGEEILSGAIKGYFYLYDLNTSKRTAEIRGHTHDINSVSYLDHSGNVFITGSDDYYIKIWDKRVLKNSSSDMTQRNKPQSPVGYLTGHPRGIAHVTSKQDGTYVLSNAKDDTAKLWDIRKMETNSSRINYRRGEIDNHFDYRDISMSSFPASLGEPDISLQTYRGHRVKQTLIRCYFSPLESTAQKYIYSGSADGMVYVYDVLTGELVRKLGSDVDRSGLIRDLVWSPNVPEILTTGWDGTVTKWDEWCDSRQQ